MRDSAWAFRIALGVLSSLLVALPSAAYGLLEDEMVPEGKWFFRASFRQATHQEFFDRGKNEGTLKDALIPDPEVRDQIEGDITRKISRTDLLFTFGISDRWNLSLDLPYLDMTQESSLATVAGAGPEAAAELERRQLQSRTLSGVGDVRLTSQHRPVFSDRAGFIWGYGLVIPGGSQQTPFVDRTTFDLRSPLPAYFMFLHATSYLGGSRSRLDFRASAERGFRGDVETPAGENKYLDPGSRVAATVGYSGEIGPVALGVEAELRVARASTLARERLGDTVRALAGRFHLGIGNVAQLEEGPVAFPYQVLLEVEHIARGTNTPLGSFFSLTFQTYF